MGAVLAGAHESGVLDARRCGGFIGTSAGSIVAAALAAGVDPRSRLGRLPEQPSVRGASGDGDGEDGFVGRALRLGGAAAGVAAGPLASIALRSTAPGGAVVRRTALGRIAPGRRSLAQLGRMVDELGARWDSRLEIATVELGSGRRVMLDGSGSPPASVGEAVQASCAIPGVFRPVVIDGRSYVDGGAWSPTNMDAARVARGARVLCLNPTGSMPAAAAMPLGAFGPVSRAMAAIEALALRQQGARVTTISPDRGSAGVMGANLMDAGPRDEVIAAGLEQGRRLAWR